MVVLTLAVEPFAVAVTVAISFDSTETVVAVKVAVEVPETIVTLAGTVRSAFELVS